MSKKQSKEYRIGVQRLRELGDSNCVEEIGVFWNACDDAADEIERRDEKIDALRAEVVSLTAKLSYTKMTAVAMLTPDDATLAEVRQWEKEYEARMQDPKRIRTAGKDGIGSDAWLRKADEAWKKGLCSYCCVRPIHRKFPVNLGICKECDEAVERTVAGKGGEE